MAATDPIRRIVDHVRAAPPRCGQSRLVCVDGPAGAGKSTLAGRLAEALGAPVVALDDLYEGWTQDLGAPLAERIEAWLLLPWSVGLPGRYLRYDWAAGRYVAWEAVPAADVLVIEGCGSASARVRRRASAVIWVSAPEDERLRRGLARDGAVMEPDWRAWQAREAAHFRDDRTEAAATVRVDGTTGTVALA